jgi:ATP-binding cassette subfamily B protein
MSGHRSHRHGPTGLLQVATRFGPYIRKQWPLIAGSFAALLAEVAFRTMEPWPLKFIFDHLFRVKPHGRPPLFSWINVHDPSVIILLSAAAIVVITGLRSLADYGNTIGFALVGNRVLSEVRRDLYHHLHALSLAFHNRARSGDLIVRVMSDVSMVKDVAVNAALPLAADSLILLGMIGVMFWLHWKLALVAFAVLPVFWLWTSRLSVRIREAAREQRKRESTMAATAAETIGAIRVVQALSLEGLFTGRFHLKNRESQREDMKGARLTAALGRSIGFLVAASTAIVLAYGARLVRSGELTPGQLLVFMTYLKDAFRPVRDFAKYSGRIAKAAAAGERVIHLLDQTPEVRDLPGAVPAPAFRGDIRFQGVTFAYEPERVIFDRVDLAVDARQRVAIVGPSGIGKSTLASLLLRLYDPIRGRVMIDGRDIRDYTLATLRPQISVVLQDTLLFAASARDNIAYGSPSATDEEVEQAARLANAHDFILALPQGYATVLGERGVTLSGGQRQRIAIARAAIRRAPILILDEPTTGLDEENERAVIEALERLSRGRTSLFITHDLGLAARADLIFYLERGRVIESGTHEDLMQADGRYATLYRMQTNAHARFAGMA